MESSIGGNKLTSHFLLYCLVLVSSFKTIQMKLNMVREQYSSFQSMGMILILPSFRKTTTSYYSHPPPSCLCKISILAARR